MKKIDFIVINEHTLCYTTPIPNQAGILRASVLRGSPYSELTGTIIIPSTGVRLATQADFKTYRISPDGYDTCPYHNFPKS